MLLHCCVAMPIHLNTVVKRRKCDNYSLPISILLLFCCGYAMQEADQLLAKLAEEYSQEITLPTDEISTLRKQLKSREVTISALGRHNCGKSTCLGAVLYCQ